MSTSSRSRALDQVIRAGKLLVCLVATLLTGCVRYVAPEPVASPSYLERLEIQQDGNIKVGAVVLSAEESQAAFAANLAAKGIQPIWLEIVNLGDHEYTLLVNSIDPDYFSPSEAAWISRGPGERGGEEKLHFFVRQGIPITVPPRGTISGFVYSNLDPGGKAFEVMLSTENSLLAFPFVQEAPGLKLDWKHVDFDKLYTPGEMRDLDVAGLQDYLASLPCCVLGGDQESPGDPLNIAVVGEGPQLLFSFLRQGWDMTETVSARSAVATAGSSVFSSRYRTSPVSPLFLFDRSQDLALQKARGSVDERNHLRLWLAPVTVDNKPVWVGQISRDIGVKLSSKTVVTHRIDPFVDEARYYLAVNLASSQSVARLGYVGGVGMSTTADPRYNYTDDPYYTDGLRLVLFLSSDRVSLDHIVWLDWETLPDVDSYAEP